MSTDNLRILYYTWEELTKDDILEVFHRLDYAITVCNHPFTKYEEDEQLIEAVIRAAREGKCEYIFSFNYFPDLSRAAKKLGIIYVCWCFDSPMLTLWSKTVQNECNRIYTFDYMLMDYLKKKGIKTVSYKPLACNTHRMEREFLRNEPHFEHQITFLGNLYNDRYDFYGKVKYLPDYLKGYVDAAIEAQLQIYGMDIISSTVNEKIGSELLKYLKFNMSDNYLSCDREILLNMIRRHVTVIERKRLLSVIGEFFPLDIYSQKKPEDIKGKYLGYAGYFTEMPKVFRNSKINLNFTLRTILSGIPLRVIDIMGAGGFCMTNYQAELQEYFENGRDIVWFEDPEDLFERIKYYLTHDAERTKIAENGNTIIKNCFSYDAVVPTLFS